VLVNFRSGSARVRGHLARTRPVRRVASLPLGRTAVASLCGWPRARSAARCVTPEPGRPSSFFPLPCSASGRCRRSRSVGPLCRVRRASPPHRVSSTACLRGPPSGAANLTRSVRSGASLLAPPRPRRALDHHDRRLQFAQLGAT
jgi:hypothetical protein